MKKSIAVFLYSLLAGTAFAAGNPCATAKPGAAPPASITRPAGYQPLVGDAALGGRLWNDSKLSTNGMSCNTCHTEHGAFRVGFSQPYPHRVQMAKDRFGLKTVHLDEMVQGCMVMPMAAKPLPWESKELAALVAYTKTVQKTFRPGAKAPANPCSAKSANPCATRPANPCAKR